MRRSADAVGEGDGGVLLVYVPLAALAAEAADAGENRGGAGRPDVQLPGVRDVLDGRSRTSCLAQRTALPAAANAPDTGGALGGALDAASTDLAGLGGTGLAARSAAEAEAGLGHRDDGHAPADDRFAEDGVDRCSLPAERAP
ncbi:hypothetical protein OG427_38810 [Streptomyces sp. NBC_00133]|uniref:hypothetical protein n=1 Tax=Streptomyces sp. NBC_00133 TaxID=2903624 RepID=UPI003253DC76